VADHDSGESLSPLVGDRRGAVPSAIERNCASSTAATTEDATTSERTGRRPGRTPRARPSEKAREACRWAEHGDDPVKARDREPFS